MDIKNVSCNGSTDGNVRLVLRTTVAPGTVSILNLNTNTVIPNIASPVNFPFGSILTPVINGLQFTLNGSYTWDNLPAGRYRVTLTDSALIPCSKEFEFEITEPDTLELDYEILPGSCGESTATLLGISLGGTPNYSYTLENAAIGYGPVTKTSGEFKNLVVDTVNPYTLSVEDSNGCTASMSILITSTNGFEVIVGKKDVTCFGQCNGSISAVAIGGVPPYKFILSSEVPGEHADTSTCSDSECVDSYTFDGLCANDYTLTAIDANGCKFTYPDTISIQQPTQIQFTGLTVGQITCNECCDGSITIDTITGGTGPYTVELTKVPEDQIPPSTIFTDGSSVAVTINNLKFGSYEITITDSTGCSRIIKVGINVPNTPTIS